MCWSNWSNWSNFLGHNPGNLTFDVAAGGTDYGGQISATPYTETELTTAVTVPSVSQAFDTYLNGYYGYVFAANLKDPSVSTILVQVQGGSISDDLYLNFPSNEFTVVNSSSFGFPTGQILLGGTTEVATFNGGANGVTLTIDIDSAYASNYGVIADIIHGVWYLNASSATSGSKNVVFSILDDAASNSYATVVVNESGDVPLNQTLKGDDNANLIVGGVGDDTIKGGAGDDILNGASGNDGLFGGDGNDTLTGGAGDDLLDGGLGVNTAVYDTAASAVKVTLGTGVSQDTIGAGHDRLTNIQNLTGSNFDDTLTGDGNANVLTGGAGNDILKGGDGNDTLSGGAGDDILDGGLGVNTAVYDTATGAVTVTLGTPGVSQDTIGAGHDTLTNIQNLTGSDFNDSLSGDANANVLSGGSGDDLLRGAQGNDSLYGGAANDTLTGGAGDDLLDGGNGVNTAAYDTNASAVTVTLGTPGVSQDTIGAGHDTLTNIQNLTGSSFGDVLTGDGNANVLTGGAGDDILRGAQGSDTLFGGDGNDSLTGGAGDDIIDGGNGIDTAGYDANATAVTVSLALQGIAQNTGAGLDTLTNIENLTGSAFNDVLTGDGNDNVIIGGLGNDTMVGGGNTSVHNDGGLAGGDGLGGDVVSYSMATAGVTVSLALLAAQNTLGAGTDTLSGFEDLTGSNFNDTLAGDNGANILTGGSGDDILRGAQGNDYLYGGDGNDTLAGGLGDDIIDGGNGIDTLAYDTAANGVVINLSIPGQVVVSGQGNDVFRNVENVLGSNFADTLTGTTGDNVLTGAGGDDVIKAAAGNDTVFGGDGNDNITGGAGDDVMDGGNGIDTAAYDANGTAVTVSLALQGTSQDTSVGGVGGAGHDTLTNFENLSGSANNDVLTGDGNDNVIIGGLGNDTMVGGGNTAVHNDGGLAGGDGLGGDVASYSTATAGVTVSLALLTAQNTIGAGTDTLSGFEDLTGSNFNDTLQGDANANILTGGSGDDVLRGAQGNDYLYGGDGNDTLVGGLGDDIIDGGNGIDTLAYDTAANGVVINLGIPGQVVVSGQGNDIFRNVENVLGSNSDDTLTGNTGDNVLTGGNGNDILKAAAGNDTVFGGAGNDNITGGAGNDTMDGGTGADSFVFNTNFGQDVINNFVTTAGSEHDTIDFQTSVFADFAAVQAHMVQTGTDATITLDASNSITLHNVTGTLAADSFAFHS